MVETDPKKAQAAMESEIDTLRQKLSELEESPAEEESKLEKYEGVFAEYQEMVVQFGYVTLFAAALRHQLGPDCDDRVVQRVCHVMHSQKESLRVIFENIDQSGDECISLNEFKLAIGELGLDFIDEEVRDAIFTLMDVNGDGEVEYREFIDAFKVIDTHNIGGESMGVKSKKKRIWLRRSN